MLEAVKDKKNFIPVNEPLLNGNEKKYLNQCIDTGWISSEGPFVKQFEQNFAKRVDRTYGIAVSSGTAALDIAVRALRLGPGDEVIMPTFTIISCASAVMNAGVMPVLVDSLPDTWNMDVEQIEAKITKKTKAIMVVHTYGLPVDIDPVMALAKKYNLKIIEDAAEAIGQTYKGKPCGSFGDVSIVSFYTNKHVTTGEGGMVLTDDAQIAERARSLRNLCFQAGKRFVHEEIGFNYRMTNMQAAIGLAQLEQLDTFLKKKRLIGKLYTQQLRLLGYFELPHTHTAFADNVFWVYGLVVKESAPFTAQEVMQKLQKKGIGTRPFFWSMHEQPVFNKVGMFIGESYPVAQRLARRGFYIPSGLALTEEQIDHVVGAIKEIVT